MLEMKEMIIGKSESDNMSINSPILFVLKFFGVDFFRSESGVTTIIILSSE